MSNGEGHHFNLRIGRVSIVWVQQVLVGCTHIDFFECSVVSPAGSEPNPTGSMAKIRLFHIGLDRDLLGSYFQLAARGQDRPVLFAKWLALRPPASTHQQIVRGSFKNERLLLD